MKNSSVQHDLTAAFAMTRLSLMRRRSLCISLHRFNSTSTTDLLAEITSSAEGIARPSRRVYWAWSNPLNGAPEPLMIGGVRKVSISLPLKTLPLLCRRNHFDSAVAAQYIDCQYPNSSSCTTSIWA
jgi:hypothetical protein